MGKYADLFKDVYSIFNTNGWKAEGIATYPENFVGALTTEYIRVTVLAGGRSRTGQLNSVSGQLMIDIFIPAGGGPTRAAQIADKLDTYLVGQNLKTGGSGNTQFSDASNLTAVGIDRDNSNLYRSNYSLPFNFFGA